jgi:hypothetical protein
MTLLPQDAWLVALLEVSRDLREFVLRYSSVGEMREEGLTVHLAHLFEQLSTKLPRGLDAACDIKLEGQRGEAYHGADLELWLTGGGLALGFRLQAKRLFPPPRGRARSEGQYTHLDHVIGKNPGIPQIDQLINNTPAGLTAGYLFYNGLERTDVMTVPSACCQGELWAATLSNDAIGLTWAPAAAFDAPGQTKQKAFPDVYKRCTPLLCLAVCPKGGDTLPSRASLSRVPLPLRAAASLPLAMGPLRLTAPVEQRAGWQDRLHSTEIAWSSPPPYLERLQETGSAGLGGQERPAAVIVVLSESDL